jgi:outer membrane protein assembly factor BamB
LQSGRCFVIVRGEKSLQDRSMDQHLFIGCNGNVAAIDASSGAELWRTKLKPGVLSATNYEDVAVLDHEGKVYAGCNGHLFCLDAESGAILWHNELNGFGHNDVTLSIGGRSIQIMHKVHHRNT